MSASDLLLARIAKLEARLAVEIAAKANWKRRAELWRVRYQRDKKRGLLV